MENYFVSAGIIAVVYILFKMVEMKFMLKETETETKPLKDLIRDDIIVYISSIIGLFIYDQMVPSIIKKQDTGAFTGKAEF